GGFDQARVIRAAAGSQFRIKYECDALDAGRNLFEQLQPFARQRELDVRESDRVSARTRQAFDEAFSDGVRDHRKDDRDCTCLPQERSRHRRASGQNHVGLVGAPRHQHSGASRHHYSSSGPLSLASSVPLPIFVDNGGLVSYGVDNVDQYQRAASYVDLILKGAKPSELPVQQPVKFELVISLKTARELGITVPATLIATADEVIS